MRNLSPLVLASLLVAGCGGGGSSHSGGTPAAQGKGTAIVSITWPERSARFVPLASNSVVVTLSRGGVLAAQQIVARPAGGPSTVTAAFTSLVYGTFDVGIEARPNADGTGNTQARGAAQMAVSEDVPGSASVSLATTVTSLAILPTTFNKRQTATVSVSATDSAGAIVLLQVGSASETVSWSADNILNSLGVSVPAVTLSGSTGASVVLTGVHSGTTHIHAVLGLGLATPLTATGDVTVNAIVDGTGTVTIS